MIFEADDIVLDALREKLDLPPNASLLTIFDKSLNRIIKVVEMNENLEIIRSNTPIGWQWYSVREKEWSPICNYKKDEAQKMASSFGDGRIRPVYAGPAVEGYVV